MRRWCSFATQEGVLPALPRWGTRPPMVPRIPSVGLTSRVAGPLLHPCPSGERVRLDWRGTKRKVSYSAHCKERRAQGDGEVSLGRSAQEIPYSTLSLCGQPDGCQHKSGDIGIGEPGYSSIRGHTGREKRVKESREKRLLVLIDKPTPTTNPGLASKAISLVTNTF